MTQHTWTVAEQPMVPCLGRCDPATGPDQPGWCMNGPSCRIPAREGDVIDRPCPGEVGGPHEGQHTYYCGCGGDGTAYYRLTTDPEPMLTFSDGAHLVEYLLDPDAPAPDNNGWICTGTPEADQ